MPPSIDVLTRSSAAAWPTLLIALKSPLPSPNVMVPKQSFDTRRPVLPSVAYFMEFSLLVSPKFLWREGSVIGISACPSRSESLADLVGGVWPQATPRRILAASISVRRRAVRHSDQGVTDLLLSIVGYCPWLTST